MAITSGIALVGAGMGAQSYFGNKSASAARKANAAAAEQARQARGRALDYQRPYELSGRSGLNSLTGLLTGQQFDNQGNQTNLNQDQRSALFQKSPGYQFRLDQAQLALQGSQAARGGLLSGGAMKEMNTYTQGIASDEYGNYINQLSGLAGMGQNAANSMSNAELGTGTQLANYAQQGGMAAANNYMNQGNLYGGGLSQIGGMFIGSGLSGGGGGGTSQGAGMSNSGNFQGSSPGSSSVFSGYSMPNTNLSSGKW